MTSAFVTGPNELLKLSADECKMYTPRGQK